MNGDLPPWQPSIIRTATPDPASIGEDPQLGELIRAEIRADGPITFARFMQRVLYEPGHGYYRQPLSAPGLEGHDFLTAPETHPIFGAALGRVAEQAWEILGRPSPFEVREPGAGSGALAAGLLGGLRDTASPLLGAIRYRPVELEPARVDAFRTRLVEDGFGTQLEIDGPVAGRTFVGAVIANEVLDALPVHRVVGRPDGPRELLVALDPAGAFTTFEGPPSTDDIAARLAREGVTLADGQVAEVCLGVDRWLAETTADLARGLVLLIDYAEEPAALYAPHRLGGTLRTFAQHMVGGDPFRHLGRQDLTASVDLEAVRAAARDAGLEPVGETTQAELLAATGGDLAAARLRRPDTSLQEALDLRSALARLLEPRGMGGYAVLAFGRGMPRAALPAFERLRSRSR